MHSNKILRRYLIEIMAAHALFFLVLFLSMWAWPHMLPGLVRTLVTCAPILPVLLMLAAVVRFYSVADEYQRHGMLENWALTAAVTFLWTFTYGLLERSGLPALNLVWICPAMGLTSAFFFIVRNLRGWAPDYRQRLKESSRMYQETINRRYVGEMLATMVLYIVVLSGSLHIAERLPKGAMQTAVVVTPMIPVLLTILVVIRHIRRVDEYVRQQTFENIAIAAVVTAGWTFTYGFLEGVGYPRLSMFWVWGVMGAVWAIAAIARSVLRR